MYSGELTFLNNLHLQKFSISNWRLLYGVKKFDYTNIQYVFISKVGMATQKRTTIGDRESSKKAKVSSFWEQIAYSCKLVSKVMAC